jgi:minor histocompatibility antigen H13
MLKIISSWKIPGFLQELFECKKLELSKARIMCLLLAAIPVALYFATKHWALNNIFGVLFAIVALKTISLSTTKTGLVLLWALFFYDIFWVYGTDVMVTVAKNVDLPLKISFPYAAPQ